MKCFIDIKKVDKNGSLLLQKEAKEIFPADFEGTKEAIVRAERGEGVVLNFEGIAVEIAQRTLDFIAGAAYAMGGKMQKIKGDRYLLIPQGVRISKIREK